MNEAFHYRRVLYLTVALVTMLALMIARFFWLQVVCHEPFAREAQRLTTIRRVSEPWRGGIKDRNGRPWVWSVPVVDVYADVQVCGDYVKPVARSLGPLLGLEPRQVAHCLYEGLLWRDGGPKQAVLLKRDVLLWECQALTQKLAQSSFGLNLAQLRRVDPEALGKLRTNAVIARDSQLRAYAPGNLSAHVVGPLRTVAGEIGHEGACGIEAAFNPALTGTPGLSVFTKDVRPNDPPPGRTQEVPAVDGDSVVLTIDLRLEQIAEAALADALARTGAKNGSVIIMRPGTGEILALACLPAFALEHPGAAPAEAWFNHPIMSLMEPGSVMKVLTLVTALDQGLLTLDHRINCENGWYGRVKLKDHGSYGVLTVWEAFGISSDIAFAKIGLLAGPECLYHSLTNFGLNQRTGIPLPGEMAGRFKHWTHWTEHLLSRIAFGQGLGITQLEMTMAYGAVVNDGRLMKPLLVRRIERPDGQVRTRFEPVCLRTVISPQTSHLAREALKVVLLPKHTGHSAALDFRTAGGKTGTAQKATTNGYRPDVVCASFIGHAPANRPEIVVAVFLDEPKVKPHTGGVIAAPVFRVVTEQALAYLNVPPDKGPTRGGGLQLAGQLAGGNTNPGRLTQ